MFAHGNLKEIKRDSADKCISIYWGKHRLFVQKGTVSSGIKGALIYPRAQGEDFYLDGTMLLKIGNKAFLVDETSISVSTNHGQLLFIQFHIDHLVHLL